MSQEINEASTHSRVSLGPDESYFRTMTLIRSRFSSSEASILGETPLARAERLALQVRKIVEGIAFAALSGLEARNEKVLAGHRTKSADDLLIWLNKKNLLKLPSAQRIGPAVTGFKVVMEGGAGSAAGLDQDVGSLLRMFSRASALIHEHHPERYTEAKILADLQEIEADLRKLREWLWLHIMFLCGKAFLVQMGQYGTASFMVNLTKESQ